MPAKVDKLLVCGEHLSAVIFMSTTGVLDCKVVKQSINGILYDIVQHILLPQLMPYNGSNPLSIVVMDNTSIHHSDGVYDVISDSGALWVPCSHLSTVTRSSISSSAWSRLLVG